MVFRVGQMGRSPNLKAPRVITSRLAQEVVNGVVRFFKGGVVANHMIANLIRALAVYMAVMDTVDGHMLTPLGEGLLAKSFICAMVEAPYALSVVAMGDIPALVVADTALQRVYGSGAYDLSSGQVDSPVSLFVHGVYLSCMYSEGEACSRDKATTYPRLPSGRPPFSVSILYHILKPNW